jgi:superfamily I DNA and/or RNA helicase
MERLLAQCINSGREEFRVLANHRRAVSAWLKLFATFFDRDNAKYVGTDDGETLPGWRDNRAVAEQLHLQFRMRSDIADVVSHAFYNNQLESHPSVDLRDRPDWLKAFAAELDVPGGILWIDTPPGDRFQNPTPSVNEDQAQIAARLLARAVELGADPRRDAVILSPYKLQRGEVRNCLIGRHDAVLAEAVHTADSFQGQEAELVILPLTRGPPLLGRKTGKATERYGFLVQEERANVMISRSRELLVILGDFDFFADAVSVEQKNNPAAPMDLGFWSRLCDRIRRTGRVISYDELPPKLGLK